MDRPDGAEATDHFLDFFYNGNLVYREIYVRLSIDQETCLLPIPDLDMDERGAVVRKHTMPEEKRKYSIES